jgi:hypothetical protein
MLATKNHKTEVEITIKSSVALIDSGMAIENNMPINMDANVKAD